MTYTYLCPGGHTVDMAATPDALKECGQRDERTGLPCMLGAMVQYPGELNPPKIG